MIFVLVYLIIGLMVSLNDHRLQLKDPLDDTLRDLFDYLPVWRLVGTLFAGVCIQTLLWPAILYNYAVSRLP